jgi:uncharacterized protein
MPDRPVSLGMRLVLARAHAIKFRATVLQRAFSEVTLGFFDRKKKRYQQIPIKEQVEVLSFVGNIVEKDGEPMLHAHVVVAKADGTAHGGHFLQARVWPTLEMIASEMPVHLRRKHDDETGLALIDLRS